MVAGRDAPTALTEVYVIDREGGEPAPVATGHDAFARTVAWTLDGSGLLVVAAFGDPLGQASLLRVGARRRGERRSCAVSGPQRHARESGVPGRAAQVTADGTVLFCVRDNGCTHVYGVTTSSSTVPGSLLILDPRASDGYGKRFFDAARPA